MPNSALKMAGYIQGIILDMDGVTADSHPFYEMAWSTLLCGGTGRSVSVANQSFLREGRMRRDMLAHFFPCASSDEREVLGRRKEELCTANLHRLQPVAGGAQWIHDLASQKIPPM